MSVENPNHGGILINALGKGCMCLLFAQGHFGENSMLILFFFSFFRDKLTGMRLLSFSSPISISCHNEEENVRMLA